MEVKSGSVNLVNAYNSTLEASFVDEEGNPLNLSYITGGGPVTMTVTENADNLRTADVFLVVYDRSSRMVSLQQWEVDLNHPLQLVQSQTIPPNVEVGEVKIIILDENLAPLTAAQAIGT